MTIYQIILTFIISLIVVKVGHKITRKAFFKYVKKNAEGIKKDWEECDK